MSNTRDQVIERYGVDPETVGNRHRGWWIVAEIDEEEKVAGAQIGDLCVEARDGAWNEPDMSVGRYPNYRGTSQDYGDETYRRYYFAPLEKPAEAPETPAAGEDVRERVLALIESAIDWIYDEETDSTLSDESDRRKAVAELREAAALLHSAAAPMDDEAAMIAQMRAGADAVADGSLDPDDFANLWVQRLSSLLRAALRSEAPGEKEARDVGYMLGVLHAAEHVFGHGQDLIAAELVDEIMDGFGARRVKDLAKAESVEIRWSEVNAIRADRRGEAPGDGPVGAVCANCGAPNAAIAGGELDPDEAFCSVECYEQLRELGCPQEHGGDYRPKPARRGEGGGE